MRNFLLLMATTFATISYAQPTINSASFIVPNEAHTLTVDTIPAITISAPSTMAQTWNYTNLAAHTLDTTEVYDAASGVAFANFPTTTMRAPNSFMGAEAYIKVTNNQVQVIGFSGDFSGMTGGLPIPIPNAITMTDPLELQYAPITLNTKATHTGAFGFKFNTNAVPQLDSLIEAQLPFGEVDSLRFTFTSMRRDTADAFGNLSVPGATYNNVLRVKQTEFRDQKIEILVVVPFIGGSWVDIGAVAGGGIPGIGQDTLVSYHFIDNTKHYPVAIAEMRNGGIVEQFQYLRGSFVDTETITSDVKLTINPNPAQDYAVIQAQNLPKGSYKIRITTLLGQQLQLNELPPDAALKVDVSKLPRGIYLVSIQNQLNQIIHTQRLNVIY